MGEHVAEPDRERTSEPDFERELRDLVLTAFADGAGVSGDWTISSVPDQIPDWRVRIERRDEETATSRDEESATSRGGEAVTSRDAKTATSPDEAVGESR
ncbi:hypothetical protein BRD15_03140 [Halobacteriales archaeon SW_6_65_15]|jgi:hypothetical protein|nr:MAG: hypothetical protein BRD15_03140 [Halobacteriales archaeon SW_6_65_15]